MNTKATLIVTAVVLVTATACSRQPTVKAPEEEFGATVRDVMNSQIHDYEAAIHPNPDAIEGTDPNRLNAVLEAYRDDVADPQQGVQPITISVGGQ